MSNVSIENLGFVKGYFYKTEVFLEKLKNKFSFMQPIIGATLFYFKNRDNLGVGSADDRIARKAIEQALQKDSNFKGFAKISSSKFAAKVSLRTQPFSVSTRRKLKSTAIKAQLENSPFKVDRKIYKRTLTRVREHLLVEKAGLSVSTVETAASNLNIQASAGFPYFVKKNLILLDLILDVKGFINYWSTQAQTALLVFPSYVAYRVQQRSSGVKCRLIYVYPGLITVLEQMFLSPVLDYFINTKTPYVVGITGDDLVLRYNVLQQKGKVYSLDWQGFDWYANSYLIKDAFAIVKSMFKNMSPLESFIFDLITSYFINTPILTSESEDGVDKIIFKRRGVPSGSSFTNLIGTIVNLIFVNYYFEYRKAPIQSQHIMALGDDVVIASNATFSLEDLATFAELNFGMVLSVEKSAIFKKGHKIYFLGAYIDAFGRYINPELALYQIATTTSDLFVKCESSMDHYIRIHDKVCSVLFKYTDGHKLYDPIMQEVSKYLDGAYDSTGTYTEIYPRATAPGQVFQRTVRVTAAMKYNGWRIQ